MPTAEALSSTWVLVCSPARARILRGLGPLPAARVETLALRARQENLRALVAAPAGLGRLGVARSGILGDRRAFAAQIAQLLETHRLAGDFARLAVVAPPPMLRLLREAFPPGLTRLVAVELAMGLVDADEAELRLRVIRLFSAGG